MNEVSKANRFDWIGYVNIAIAVVVSILALMAMFTFRLNVNIFYSILMYLLILVLTLRPQRLMGKSLDAGPQEAARPFHRRPGTPTRPGVTSCVTGTARPGPHT